MVCPLFKNVLSNSQTVPPVALKGDQGASGSNGAKGERGNDGAPGPQGLKGDQGVM
jgi:hypothetical protein